MKLLTKSEYKQQQLLYDFSCDSCLKEQEIMVILNDLDENEWKYDYDHTFICEECLKKALKLIEEK